MLCNIYPVRIFKILKICDAYKTYQEILVCEIPRFLITLDK